jgi:hypothetical protein
VRTFLMVVSLMLATALPATAASTPLEGLRYLVGTWNCTYVGGGERMSYINTYAYDLDGKTLRQSTSSSAGSDEELLAYDTQHSTWTAIVIDEHGDATVMHAAGSDPTHIAYTSVYPDASITTTFDRVSDTKYTLHGRYTVGGKTITNVDTCVRAPN